MSSFSLASSLTQSVAFHQAGEVNGPPHAFGVNGLWLIDRQTDDLNERRERITSLLSVRFVRLPLPSLCSSHASLPGVKHFNMLAC